MLPKSTQTKITILIKDAGTEKTGLLAANINCRVVKADGTASALNLTGNISEIDSVNAPGLYLITLPASILDQSGKLSVTFYPVSPTTFDSQTYVDDVGISASEQILMKKVLLNNQVIDDTNALLRIYDDDGIAVVLEYYLQNEDSNRSIFNIRRKIRK